MARIWRARREMVARRRRERRRRLDGRLVRQARGSGCVASEMVLSLPGFTFHIVGVESKWR